MPSADQPIAIKNPTNPFGRLVSITGDSGRLVFGTPKVGINNLRIR